MKFSRRLCQESQTSFVLAEGTFPDFRPVGLPPPDMALALSADSFPDISFTNPRDTNEFFLPGNCDVVMVEFKDGDNGDLDIERLARHFRKYLLSNSFDFMESDNDGLFAFWKTREGIIALACDAGGSNIAQHGLECLEKGYSVNYAPEETVLGATAGNSLVFHRHLSANAFHPEDFSEENDIEGSETFKDACSLLDSLYTAQEPRNNSAPGPK